MNAVLTATARFPNGLLWLMAEHDREILIPDIDGVANFWASHNAWGVAVQHDAEGDVQVSVGKHAPDDQTLVLLHEGVLHSSRQLIEIQTVYLDRLARFRTDSQDAGIIIWGDDPGQPERVHIQCRNFEEML